MWVDSCLLSELGQPDWADAEAWLGQAERLRLSTMRRPSRRLQFLASRWLLRKLAGAKLGIAPERLALDASEAGAPYFPDHPGCFPAISHSGERVACALARQPVGLDLETPSPKRSIAQIAEWLFSPDEQEMLRQNAAQAPDLFLHMWTLREAWLKQRGQGLSGDAMRALRWLDARPDNADALTAQLKDGAVLALSGAVGQFAELALPADAGSSPRHWRSEAV
ncbi:4'-phosphopantetheinyl transferase superfamily protein [Chromobacterium sp. ATCC 53434]|uniref:4'-phosphopantetheinyl transferase family protein n=1 Tax=Chromobacterium sp. (strain ATCC 53434 / SC 14030) TaxID=2059672 RepID=UPI0013053155|nr:4'-phosphopantetheinyl transferase superfamily protein [Chromobacterium sp. ATCC 53434]